jgi:hypothetical protein
MEALFQKKAAGDKRKPERVNAAGPPGHFRGAK